jgi:hypothetical protein
MKEKEMTQMSGYQKKKTRDIVPGVEEKHAMLIFVSFLST